VKRLVLVISAPVLCLLALAGMRAEARTRVKASDAEPYHLKAKQTLEALPYQLNGWVGRDEEIPAAAVKLLRPNCMINRTYVNPRRIDQSAGFLIVQCKDSRDMLGHYPPVCYPAHGMTMVSETRRDFAAGSMTIPGTEYVFSHGEGSRRSDTVVYNFMVIPGVGFARDMDGVLKSAADYQQRYFGATQVQVTLDGDVPQPERDRIFADLVGANVSTIDLLKSGGIR
jgi:hypothetical protein